MSLLSDPDFIIHNLRLSYLRNVEDPYGPRLISLSPSYTSNPYILASNLADLERWPELAAPISPAPSDDEGEKGLDGRTSRGATPQKPSGLAGVGHHHERNGQDSAKGEDGGRGRPSGFPGATRLKYTTTIIGGNRSGAFGLRVSGSGGKKAGDVEKAARRASARFESRRRRPSDGMRVAGNFEEATVLEASDEDREGGRNGRSEKSPLGVNIVGPSGGSNVSVMPKSTPPPLDVSAISGEVTGGASQNLTTTNSSPSHHRHSPSQDQPQAAGVLTKTISSSSAGSTSAAATATPPKAVGFIPNFKGAAEMEARRRLRLQARGRGGPGGLGTGMRGGAQPTQPLSLRDIESSSSSASEPEPPSDTEGDKAQSSDEDISGHLPADSDSDALAAGEDSAEEDGFDSAPVIDGSLAHEFDPVFSATRGGDNLGSGSDVASMLSMSHSLMSTPNESMHNPSGIPGRRGTRLSPVSEHRIKDATRRSRSNSDRNGSASRHRNSASSITGSHHPHHSEHPHKHSAGGSTGEPSASGSRHHHSPTTHHSSSGHKPDELTFPRKKVPPIRPAKSALTAMLAKTSSSSNPFEEYYAAISGRAEGDSKIVAVYFPKAVKPMGQVMELNVRKDATIEEVLGHALYKYWEEGWLPKIDEGLEGEEDPKWITVCSAIGWILRIAEEDGEVDEDFPPPDRTGKISKFNFDAYAVLEGSPAQIQQNKTLESKIQRRPSRIMGKKKKQSPDSGLLSVGSSLAPGTSATPSPLGMSPAFGSLTSGLGPQMFLRIRVAETADAVHISTTIPVTAGMYMQEVLEAVCKKRKLNPNEYALLVRDMSVLILLDRTVASLEGKSDLVLVKRSMLPRYGIVDTGKSSRTTDPNASIFKRMSETPGSQNSVTDYTGAYKKYVITRKLPMLVGRHERILAIDGVYLHIMPSAKRATGMFENGRTSSYHIRSVVACQQSAKSSSSFKLVVHRDGGTKRYDFEAENPKAAGEIVQNVRSIKNAVERSGTFSKSRRSKQVV